MFVDFSLNKQFIMFSVASTLFRMKQLSKCINNLKSLDCRLSSIDEVLKQNNLLVCSFLKKHQQQTSDKAKPAEIKNQRDESLVQIEKQINVTLGLWHLQCTPLVLSTLLYNYSSIQFLKGSLSSALSSSARSYTNEAEKKVFATLSKVILLDGNGSLSVLKQFSQVNLVMVLKQFVQLKPECFLQMCRLSNLLALQWIKEGNLQSASAILEFLLEKKDLIKKQDHETMSHHFLLGLNLDSQADDVSVCDVMSLLLGLCYTLDGKYQDCAEIIHVPAKDRSTDIQFYGKFLKAYSLLHQNEAELALETLADAESSIPMFQAMVYNLIGSCYDKLNKPHNALLNFRLAMEKCFTYKIPLYNISVLYRRLGLNDVALESLNLLVTALEEEDTNKNEASTIPNEEAIDFNLLVGRYVVETICPDINLEEALYEFARRCLEMGQFEIASQKYLNLINILHNKRVQVRRSTCPEIILPSTRTVFLETAYSLVMSERFDDAVTICERILSRNSHSNQSFNDTYTQESTMSQLECSLPLTGGSADCSISQKSQNEGISSSQKRKISDTSFECSQQVLEIHCDEASSKDEISACIYKADALIHLQTLDEASQCLSRAILLVEDLPMAAPPGAEGENTPKQKKRKISNSALPHSLDPRSFGSNTPLLASKVYSMKALVMGEMGKNQDAIHFSRLCLQRMPDIEEYTFQHVTLLRQAGRQQEACATWLSHRKIDRRMDPFLIAKMIKLKVEQIREESKQLTKSPATSASGQKVSRLDVLNMDKDCLESLKRKKTF